MGTGRTLRKESRQHGHHIYSVKAIKLETLDRKVEVASGNTPHASSVPMTRILAFLRRLVKRAKMSSTIPNHGTGCSWRVRPVWFLSHAEAQRRGDSGAKANAPFPPSRNRGRFAAAWSSGRRSPSPPTRQCGNAASASRRPRRAAPKRGPGRVSPRRAASPTSPARACGNRPRGARGRPCRTPATACRRSA